MSGIYIHIPFCKQACHYCDFHFSTSLKKKDEMFEAIVNELILRKKEFETEWVETIYFGGGTPSLLSDEEINLILSTVNHHYNVIDTPEITLEANPDDLSDDRIESLSRTPINRLSIGIQSFYESDLKLMNRAHNATEAVSCLKTATRFFKNISVDLIYGIPNMSMENWIKNIETVLSFNIPHLSCYALTVEPKTALKKLIDTGKIDNPKDDIAALHFLKLVQILEENDFVHYETSNFGKKEYFSKNNTAYWLGKKYIGVGPSAHSYDGKSRSWNIANNSIYIKKIAQSILPSETEFLSLTDQYNEYIMTRLRTIWGVDSIEILEKFGKKYYDYFFNQLENLPNKNHIYLVENLLKVTNEGKFYTDGIASNLFFID